MGGKERDVSVTGVVGPEPGLDAQTDTDTVADLQDRIDVLTAFTGGIVIELDRDGRYLRVWTGEPQLLVRPVEELLGHTVTHVLGPEVGTRFHDAFREVADTGTSMAFEYSLDVQAGRRTFSCEIRPRESRGGAPRTVTLLIRDVTAAKALEAKLLQTERLAALGLLSASVGHEIRQPLAYVSTSLDVLERELAHVPLSEPARASLENIRSGARRIAEIAASLHLLAPHRRPANRSVDVRRPLKAALDLCASEIVGLQVDCSLADLPPIRGDEGALCQVFANLILNAAQAFLPSSARRKIVRVSAALAGDSVRVRVADTGQGIAPDQLEHVFDPFFTTKGSEGTGLGLFVTRGIVEAHGGTIAIESEVGLGTTVDVLFPAARADEASPREPTTGVHPVQARHRTAEAASLTHPRLELLIVDDERRFLDSLRLALGDLHEVETRTSASDALELIEKAPHRYDVVVCDLSMPEVDGVTFYERMKSLGVGDRFVLMTGGAFTPRAAEFIASNACATIGKPFPLDQLLVLLDDVSRNRRAS